MGGRQDRVWQGGALQSEDYCLRSKIEIDFCEVYAAWQGSTWGIGYGWCEVSSSWSGTSETQRNPLRWQI